MTIIYITGVDLSGSNPNKTYNIPSNTSSVKIWVGNLFFYPTTDYILSAGTITFQKAVYDQSPIAIEYILEDEDSGDACCNTLKMVRVTGLGKEIFNENLGTGDNSENSYSTEQGNLISGSVTLKYGTSGSNDLTELVLDTDYTIDLDSGDILLTSGGVTKINEKVLYCDYIYAVVSDTMISTFLSSACYQLETDSGNWWGAEKTSIQYFDGREDYRYPHSDRPYVKTAVLEDFLQLKNKSVQSITEILFIHGKDESGNLDTEEIESSQYRFTEIGEIIFLNVDLPIGRKAVKVTYTHGYDDIPEIIKELCSLYAGVQALIHISGGSFQDISTYSLGRKSFSVGQIYINIDNSLRQFKARIEILLNTVGRKMDVI